MFYGIRFIYDGVPSEQFGLYVANFDSGMMTSPAGTDIELVTDIVRRKAKPYFYGVQQKPVLTFPITIVSEDIVDAYGRNAIFKWLFGRQEYKWLQIEQSDLEGMWFRCLLTAPQKVDIGNFTYGIKCTVTCDAPWGWSDEFNNVYSLTTNTTAISYNNLTDADDYLYPKTAFTLDISATSLSITNASDSGRVFSFTGLTGGETIAVDNDLGTIISSTSLNRLSHFNLKYFRLVPGINSLSVAGRGSLLITSRFPKKFGG
jgi:hypothetical protein